MARRDVINKINKQQPLPDGHKETWREYQYERGSHVYFIEISVIKSYAKKSLTVEINK